MGLISKKQATAFAEHIREQVDAFCRDRYGKYISFLRRAQNSDHEAAKELQEHEKQVAEYEHDFFIAYCEWLREQEEM